MAGSTTIASVGAAASITLCTPAIFAGSHSWDFSEVFSTADESVQFIELKECCGENFEVFLSGLQVTSQSTGNVFTFPSNLKPPTGMKHLLLATQSFADLPGAPAPDFIIPEGFFDPDGDTIRYHVYDTWIIGAGQVPTNCVDSLNRNGTTGPNTPTNYAGETGQVDACPCAWDLNGDSAVGPADLAALLDAWGPNPGHPADFNGNGSVGPEDLAALLDHWGDCP